MAIQTIKRILANLICGKLNKYQIITIHCSLFLNFSLWYHFNYLLLYYTAMKREPFPIALVNGNVSSEGRLVVLINGTFGSVCNDNFGYEEAQVACRQLNYTGAERDVHRAIQEFGIGDASEPIYFDNVICTGDENYLYECNHTMNHNCEHTEDVGVVCIDGK